MIEVIKSETRGHADHGWLNAKHTFSFAEYHNPERVRFGPLRDINEDRIAPGKGFGTHPHRDMEIVTYPISGAVEHKDSMGNNFVVAEGEVQRMSAGTGIMHSEFNYSDSEELHFLQVWIEPNQKGIQPGYEQKKIVQTAALTPLVTPDGRDDSLKVHQDANLFRLVLGAGESIQLDALTRYGYLHVIEGGAVIEHDVFGMGDAIGIYQESMHVQSGENGLTALWFDLPEVV